MNTAKRLRNIFLILVVAILAFVFMDFHLAKSVTHNNHNWASAHTGVEEGFRPQKTTLYIARAQDDPLTQSLAYAVYQHASKSDYFSPILLDHVPESHQYPIILVSVTGNQFFWTPFYARSTLNTQFVYSNGQSVATLEMPEKFAEQESGAQPSINGKGDAEQVDQSFGLLSLPGYRRLTCEMAAKSIVSDLEIIVQAN